MTNYPDLALYIDGRWRQGSDGSGEDVINPANDAVLGHLPHASAADLDEAVTAAEKGLAVWRRTPSFQRAQIMHRAAALIRDRQELIATALTLEEGKPIAESRLEVASAADIVDWFAEEGRRAYGRIIEGRHETIRYHVLKEPVGVALSLTPWNFPINTPSRKIAAGLAAGCAVIAKAAEETPASAIELVRAFADAGLPAGVLNLVFGVPDTVSRHLMGAEAVRKVSFTGSVPVGKHLAALAAQRMQRTTMELGGHSPVIVFDDVDVDRAADILVAGKFRNAGQICISPTRFYVQEKIYGKFVQAFVERTSAIVVGDGLDPKTTMGPLANPRRIDAVAGFIADARDRGAEVRAGGERIHNRGFHFQPTVLADVPDDARVMTEEPFGPLAPMTSFTTIDDVSERANALPFGLAAYAFSNSLDRVNRIAEGIQTGLMGINSLAVALPEVPFGGVKESGHGSEGGQEGLEPFLVTKSVAQQNSV